jgi:hypothetical protein
MGLESISAVTSLQSPESFIASNITDTGFAISNHADVAAVPGFITLHTDHMHGLRSLSTLITLRSLDLYSCFNITGCGLQCLCVLTPSLQFLILDRCENRHGACGSHCVGPCPFLTPVTAA